MFNTKYNHRQNLEYKSKNQIKIITSLASQALTRGGSGYSETKLLPLQFCFLLIRAVTSERHSSHKVTSCIKHNQREKEIYVDACSRLSEPCSPLAVTILCLGCSHSPRNAHLVKPQSCHCCGSSRSVIL